MSEFIEDALSEARNLVAILEIAIENGDDPENIEEACIWIDAACDTLKGIAEELANIMKAIEERDGGERR